MPDFVVSTAFKASEDTVTKTLQREEKAAKKFGITADRAFRKATKSAGLFGTITKSLVVSRAITAGTAAMSRGIRSVVEEFISFDDAITQAAAKMPGNIKRGTEAFKALEQQARKTGAQTKFSATEAAEGLNFLAMAGFTAEQSMSALPGVVQLATATSMDLARATDIASDALGAFGLMTSDSAQLTKNLTRVNDVFAKTTTSVNVDMEMLFETMKDGAPVMTSAGQDIETFATLTGKMGAAGIKGTKAGTTLKNMMLQLQAPTAGAAKELKRLGIQVKDSDGNMRDIIDIIGEYRRATADMGSVQRDATTDLIFGRRAISGMNVLLAEGEENLKAFRDELRGSGGAAAEMAAEMEKSLGNKLKALRSAAIELGFQFLEAFKEDGKEGLEALTEAVREFDMKPIIAGAKELLADLKWLFRTVRDNMGLIKAIAGAFIAVKIAMAGISAIQAVAAFGSYITSATAATAAGTAFRAANAPIGAGAAAGGVGAAGAVAGVGAAAVGGFAIGTFLEQSFFNPMREEGDKMKDNLEALNAKLSLDVATGFQGKTVDQLEQQFAKVQAQLKNMPAPINSLEDAFDQVASLFTGQQGPIGEQTEQFNLLVEQSKQLADALAKARAAAAAQAAAAQQAQVNINANINNAPQGSTVEVDSKGTGAPKVNVNQAGAA